jgi:hypothetical protein
MGPIDRLRSQKLRRKTQKPEFRLGRLARSKLTNLNR